MSYLEGLDNWTPDRRSAMGRLAASNGVSESAELVRIAGIPRRTEFRDLTQLIYQAYKTPGGTMVPRLLQAAALQELHDYGGALVPLPVGMGKTLPSLLAPTVLDVERSVLFVKAKLRDKALEMDIPAYKMHWRFTRLPVVLSYETLSSPKQADILQRIRPQLIICDEVHALKDMKSIRTKRFLRYFKEHPDTKLFALSASIVEKTIKDYWHIIRLTHKGARCPVPTLYPKMIEWCQALDPDVPDAERREPGALMQFCAPGETARAGFRRRLIETHGVIAPQQHTDPLEGLPALELYEASPGPAPREIADAFERLTTTWETPDGDEISDPQSLFRHATTLALGYYTVWVWPNGEPDEEWLGARRAWHSWVRRYIADNRKGIDSEVTVARMCENGELYSPDWEPWQAVRGRFPREGPPKRTVWVDDWVLEAVQRKLASIRAHTLVWTTSPRVGERLAERLGLPYFGAGDERILTYSRSCVVSMRAHGEGKNLQDRFHNNILVGVPFGATAWEQLLGRTHRSGQEADTVTFHIYMHCRAMRDQLERAKRRAEYAGDTLLGDQRLTRATINYVHSDSQIRQWAAAGHPLWR